MPLTTALRSLTRTAATGAVGVVVVEGARRVVRGPAVRNGAVTVTTWGLRGWRKAEAGAEAARLAGSDIVSEARARTGEQSPLPGAGVAAHDHDH